MTIKNKEEDSIRRYDTLLFDIDNTLLDFNANELESFQKMMLEKGEQYSRERYETYRSMNEEMWRGIERGEMSIEQVVNIRFTKLMEIYGKEVDGVEWERTYRFYLNHGIQEMPDVHQVLSQLQKTYYLYVITNGMEETQAFRMKQSGLEAYFEAMFISQSIGAGKPSSVFFDYVKAHVTGFQAERALVIGDSLTSDIKGGNLAGIDTCWYCKEGTKNDSDVKPTYVIHRLKDIYSVLDD